MDIDTENEPIRNTTKSVYVLELEHNKFYVGLSYSVITRVFNHIIGTAKCDWTLKHRPKKLIALYINANEDVENAVTLRLANTLGIDAVRGGMSVNIPVTKNNAEAATKEWFQEFLNCGSIVEASEKTFLNTYKKIRHQVNNTKWLKKHI